MVINICNRDCGWLIYETYNLERTGPLNTVTLFEIHEKIESNDQDKSPFVGYLFEFCRRK